MNLEILTVFIVLNGSWKQFSLAATSVTSALEIIFIMRSAIQIYVLLTYLHSKDMTILTYNITDDSGVNLCNKFKAFQFSSDI